MDFLNWRHDSDTGVDLFPVLNRIIGYVSAKLVIKVTVNQSNEQRVPPSRNRIPNKFPSLMQKYR